MKKLIILLSTILYSCCTNTSSNKPNVEYYDSSDYTIVVADSCEYIRFGVTTYSWGGHKGNCKYCKLRNKK